MLWPMMVHSTKLEKEWKKNLFLVTESAISANNRRNYTSIRRRHSKLRLIDLSSGVTSTLVRVLQIASYISIGINDTYFALLYTWFYRLLCSIILWFDSKKKEERVKYLPTYKRNKTPLKTSYKIHIIIHLHKLYKRKSLPFLTPQNSVMF